MNLYQKLMILPLSLNKSNYYLWFWDKAFIAGADIKLMQQMDSKKALSFAEKGHRLTKLIEHSKKPIIAAINGYAFGGVQKLR